MVTVPADIVLTREVCLQEQFKEFVPYRVSRTFRRQGRFDQITIGLGDLDSSLDPALARQLCLLNNVALNYYEVWQSKDRGRSYVLNRAYLHLFVSTSPNAEDQILAIHCDPQTTDNHYKKGLHLHLKSHPINLARAHLSLCLPKIDGVISDYTGFSVAYSAMLRMLKGEVFPIIEASLLN